MACSQRADLIAAATEQRIVRHQEPGVARFDERGKDSIDVLIAAGIENSSLLPDRARDPLDGSCLRLRFRAARIDEEGDHRSGGYDIADQLEPLSGQLRGQIGSTPWRFRLPAG